MTKAIKNANHMNQNVKKSNKSRIVALALAGILAVGGITGAVCAAGLGKMPSQASVAAQTVAAKPAAKATTKKAAQATPKAETKASQSQVAKKTTTKQAATKPEDKPAAKQAATKSEAKPAAKKAEAPTQVAPTSTAKKAEAPKQEAQPAPRQEEQKAPASNANDGTEAKLSREQCVKIACDYVGAGGQAKGPAMNVSAKRVVGGGTTYYAVELDLGDVHYRVCVDAIDGHTYSSDMTHAGTTVCLDEQGNPIEGTEQPAEA
jgi:outer membrane biosynthesis protein TonB